MKTKIMNLFRMMEKSLKMEKSGEMGKSLKSLKSLMQIFATFATYASEIFVGKESCKSTVRYALWSRISLIKPLQNPYLTLTRFRLSLGSAVSRFSLASLICLCMLTVGVGNVWGDYSIAFKSYNDSGNESTTIAKLIDSGSDYISSITASKTSRTTSDGLKFGNNNNPGSLTLEMKSTGSYIGQIKASKITVKNIKKQASNGGDCQYEITYAEGGSTTGTLSLSTTASDKDINLTSTKTIESIHFYNNNKKEAFYMTGFTVVAAAAATSVTASPTSITFSANTLDGSGEAEGSATIDFSVTNGYKSSNQYLCAWTESDDDSKCEFYVNGGNASYCSGNATSVDDLSIEYYAIATGTHTGTLYINGYDSGGDPVEVTVSLSVTISAPVCANTVTITQSGHTNGSITLSSTSVTTCGDAASRQVTVSVAPNTCYAGPADASVITKTGTAASNTSYVSGPTWNGSTSKYDYVYQFTQNASGAVNFAVTLSTKTTYTVQYAAGDVPSGGGSITGSHANDTKTCGDAMDLPAASFTTTGYTQTGWSKTNGGSQYAAVGGSYIDNAAQTFYPVWTANKYTVTWSVNGSTYTTTANVSYNTTTSTPANPSVPGECTGSTFMGWTATQNYTGDSAPGNMFNGTSPTITGDITFYAVFADED